MHGPLRAFILAGSAALAVGTLQGPVQAFPAVNELLDRGGEAGDVIVNLHAQLNMIGGLMVILIGLDARAAAPTVPTGRGAGAPRVALLPAGVALYYVGGIAFSAVEAHRVAAGETFAVAVAAVEPWEAVVLVPAALAVLVGFWAYARGSLGDDGVAAGSRPRGSSHGAGAVQRQDPAPGAAPQPGRARRLRASARADGLPRRRLALRGFPWRHPFS